MTFRQKSMQPRLQTQIFLKRKSLLFRRVSKRILPPQMACRVVLFLVKLLKMLKLRLFTKLSLAE
jgi:hypothetical protein